MAKSPVVFPLKPEIELYLPVAVFLEPPGSETAKVLSLLPRQGARLASAGEVRTSGS